MAVPLAGGVARAFAQGAPGLPFRRMASAAGDRIIVILRLYGGNDGLNTVVPYHNETYYRARGRGTAADVSIPAEEVLPLPDSNTLGFHPGLAPLHELYGEGKVAIVQNVGYPDQNLSHFRSTDIWLTGSDAGVFDKTGWYAKYLEQIYPEYPEIFPADPFGIELSTGLGRTLNGRRSTTGIALRELDYIPAPPDPADPKLTHAGIEAAFVRAIARQSNVFLGSVSRATERQSVNMVAYPTDHPLSADLATVVRLIASGLETQIYIVNVDGFDTHHNQLALHGPMLSHVARGIHAFQRDLEAFGLQEKVCLMTISEFGRRVEAIGLGTDHGTAAPLFVVGNGVIGGLIGDDPDLDDLDPDGNLRMRYDFRQVYASLLTQWQGAAESDIYPAALPRRFATLPLFRGFEQPIPIAVPPIPESHVVLGMNHPNPATSYTTIPIGGITGEGRLTIHTADGRQIDSYDLAPGEREVTVDTGRYPPGAYVYVLTAGSVRESRRMIVAR